MNEIKTRLPSRQRGSFYVTVVMLVLLGAALTFALKVAPAYIGNNVLKNSMATIMAKSDYKNMDIDQIRTELVRTQRVNPVDGFDGKDVKITHESGKEFVDIDYEIRTPLVANMSVVMAFKNRFDKN